jgi:hypothetical protein
VTAVFDDRGINHVRKPLTLSSGRFTFVIELLLCVWNKLLYSELIICLSVFSKLLCVFAVGGAKISLRLFAQLIARVVLINRKDKDGLGPDKHTVTGD